MSILRVANLQFNASGTRRIDYDSVADDGVIKVTADDFTVSGNVGIGTLLPVTPLHISDGNTSISSALYTSDYLTISAQNTAPGLNIISAGNTAAGRGVFKTTRSRGTLSSPLVPLLNDNTFSLLGTIFDGTVGRATAGINMDVDGTVSSGIAPQRISFLTGTTSTRVERMRIDANGNVGIGTTTPGYTLDVAGSANISVPTLLVAGQNVMSTLNSAYAAANNITPQLAPTYNTANNAYNTANLAYANANTKLANATGTLAGSLSTTGSVTSNGYVYVTALDGGQEGGEIQLSGAGNYAGWALDAYQNNHRTFVRTGSTLANVTYFHALGGSVRMGVNKVDPLYTLDINGELNTSSRGITKGSMPVGSVIQTQYVSSGTRVSIDSTSFVEPSSTYRVSITPTSTSSIILLRYYVPMNPGGNYATNTIFTLRAFRIISGSTSYALTSAGNTNGVRNVIAGYAVRPQGYDLNDPLCACFEVIDLPNTTSACTYGFEYKRESGGSGIMYFGQTAGDNSLWGWDTDIVIVAQEIAQ